ncbi:MAG: hypothetical protein ACXVCN_14480 [Bdellovibrio sp.]
MKKNLMEISNVKKVCIVPAPASSEGQKDHAFLWGRALADSFGADFVPLLKKVSNKHQRGGDRGERALVEMEIVENYSKDMSFTHETLFIFADDVLTTGATARAAFKALGSPPYFEIWALAHRRLSCGAPTDLLYKQNV